MTTNDDIRFNRRPVSTTDVVAIRQHARVDSRTTRVMCHERTTNEQHREGRQPSTLSSVFGRVRASPSPSIGRMTTRRPSMGRWTTNDDVANANDGNTSFVDRRAFVTTHASAPVRRKLAPRASEADAEVLAYWRRVARGVERAPRPREENERNKARIAHLRSSLREVFTREGGDERASARECDLGGRMFASERERATAKDEAPGGCATASANATANGKGERGDVPYAREARDVAECGSLEEEEEEDEERRMEGFEYGVHELPRHMRDWYEPPGEEYGSFLVTSRVGREGAGAVDSARRAGEGDFNQKRNLKTHQLW